MNAETAAKRLAKVRDALHREQAAAFLAFSLVNIRYLAGCAVGPGDRFAGVLAPAEGELVIVAPAFEAARLESEKFAGRIETWREEENPYDVFARVCRDAGVDAGPVVADEQLWFRVWQGLRRSLPAVEWIDGERLMKRVRGVKLPEEIEAIRRAADVVGEALAEVVPGLRPGVREHEIAARLSAAIESREARVAFMLVQSGVNASFPHRAAGERPVAAGDTIVLDLGAVVDGFLSDVTRTVQVGAVDPEIPKVWDMLKRAHDAAVERVRPGVEPQELDRAARGVIEAAGYGPYFTHRLGHGLGMEVHEHPYIVEGAAEPLAEGAVFTVEPGVYVPGRFGMRYENDVAVTADSARVLSAGVAPDWSIPV